MGRCSLLLALVIGLVACQPGPDRQLDDYLERLERVLEQTRPDTKLSLPPRPPRHTLTPRDDSMRVSLVTPLSLKPCGVLPLVAEHNSAMGKVATPMYQWLYHQRLVTELNACDPSSLNDDGKVLRDEVLANREPQLAFLFARLLLLSDAVWFNLGDNRKGWQWRGETQAAESLQKLAEQRDADQPDPNQLFDTLQNWEVTELPASLHRSMVAVILHLNQASTMLNQAGSDACRRDTLERLKGILKAIYGERVQPHLVMAQQMDRRLTTPLRNLLTPLPNSPYFDFYLGDGPGTLRAHYYDAIQGHTHAWQQLLQRCQGNSDLQAPVAQ